MSFFTVGGGGLILFSKQRNYGNLKRTELLLLIDKKLTTLDHEFTAKVIEGSHCRLAFFFNFATLLAMIGFLAILQKSCQLFFIFFICLYMYHTMLGYCTF